MKKSRFALPATSTNEVYITYPNFNEAKKGITAKAHHFFSPIVFAKLSKSDKFSRMKLTDFYSYIMKMTWLNRARVELSKYDAGGKGYLVEEELEIYLKSQMSFLHQLKNIERWFIPYYLCTVSRRFFFFLDPIRIGRVRICDILASGLLESFFALGYDEDVPLSNNCFSLSSVRRIYDGFIKLDKNKDGSLSRDELIEMPTSIGHLSSVFVDQFFATRTSKNGVISYRTYMDLVLALENRETTQSIRYLFNVFDITGHGKISISMIEGIFYDQKCGVASKEFHDYYSFIYDTFQMKDPNYITLNELLKSGQGHIFLSTLIDDDCSKECTEEEQTYEPAEVCI